MDPWLGEIKARSLTFISVSDIDICVIYNAKQVLERWEKYSLNRMMFLYDYLKVPFLYSGYPNQAASSRPKNTSRIRGRTLKTFPC